MYVDSAYIAKYYVNEPDSAAVRAAIRGASRICSSSWALIEVVCVFQRHARQGYLDPAECQEYCDLFRAHAETGVWNLAPVTEPLLLATASLARGLPTTVPLRAGDALHVATALFLGESEIWTNDRHLLAAARHFGLTGREAR